MALYYSMLSIYHWHLSVGCERFSAQIGSSASSGSQVFPLENGITSNQGQGSQDRTCELFVQIQPEVVSFCLWKDIHSLAACEVACSLRWTEMMHVRRCILERRTITLFFFGCKKRVTETCGALPRLLRLRKGASILLLFVFFYFILSFQSRRVAQIGDET